MNKLVKIVANTLLGISLISATFGYASNDKSLFNTGSVVVHEKIDRVADASEEEFLAEKLLWKASASFAEQNGGPIVKEILRSVKELLSEDEYENLLVDVNVDTTGNIKCLWHSDYYANYDQKEGSLIRIDPDLEDKVRVFMIVSEGPPTVVLNKRNIEMDLKGTSWEDFSNKIDGSLSESDLCPLPYEKIVEIKSNEIHKVFPYPGGQIVSFYTCMYLFPKGHPEHGKFKNEIKELNHS